MTQFIKSRVWWNDHPVLPTDLADPLLSQSTGYGCLFLSFDFHISSQGPKLIEINTNAGGFATYLRMAQNEEELASLTTSLVSAFLDEYRRAGLNDKLKYLVIVDDHVEEQRLYPEMLWFAEILRNQGLAVDVASPENLKWDGKNLIHQGRRIDFVYNRLTDFRLLHPSHAELRAAATAQAVVLSPHPAAYVRVADKRHFLRLKHPLVPDMLRLKDKTTSEWLLDRDHWVFKPASRAGSQGVYRGDKISVAKLKSLPDDTLAQKFIEPGRTDDNCKYDLRVFTHDAKILGLVSRHFSGQVMEMGSAKAGWRLALPEGCKNLQHFLNDFL